MKKRRWETSSGGVLPPLLCALASWGCSVPISAGLEDGDANRVLVALETGGVAASKEEDPAAEGRFRVSVGRDDASTAVLILQQENLPPSPAPGVLASLGESSLVPSRTAEHAKLIVGTAGDLEQSLRGVEGVLAARVHLAVPTRGPLGDEPSTPPTASVLLRHRGATPPLSALDVQRLIAGAVLGLDEKNVSVVMTPVSHAAKLPDRELSRLGPITVTRGSLTPLRLVVAVGLLFNVALVTLLALLWSRMRRTAQALETALTAGDGAARDGR
ncbi:MAG: hypothetical protein KF718_18860 [Polyangiaceae bacterium]|nr:hypothetical protein [Polyangiaceae bacterium]